MVKKKVVKKNKLIKQLKENNNKVEKRMTKNMDIDSQDKYLEKLYKSILKEQELLDFTKESDLKSFTEKVRHYIEIQLGVGNSNRRSVTLLPEIKCVPFKKEDKYPKFLFRMVKNKNKTILAMPESELLSLLYKYDYYSKNQPFNIEILKDIPIFYALEQQSIISKYNGEIFKGFEYEKRFEHE